MNTPKLCLLFALTILSSCKKDENPNLVRFVTSMSPGEPALVRQVLEGFEEKNPEVEVRYEPISGTYMTLIQTRIAAGTPPDLFTLSDVNAPDLMAAGVLMPLDEWIERDGVDLDDFYPNLLDAFRHEGKLYGLPKDYNTLGLFYNKDMLAEAGVSPPKTWEELRDAAEKLTDRDAGRYGLCLTPDMARWLPFLYQAGGEYLDAEGEALLVNSLEAREALDFYAGLVRDGIATRPDQVGATWAGEAFGRGLVAMVLEGGWMIPSLRMGYSDLEFGVVELPAHRARANLAFTVAFVIPRSTRNPEGAWQLMKYLAGRDGMEAWTSLGMALPSRRSVAGQTVEGPNAAHWQALEKGVEYARPWQFTYRFTKVLDRSNVALEAVFLDRMKVGEALSDMVEYGNRVLSLTRRSD